MSVQLQNPHRSITDFVRCRSQQLPVGSCLDKLEGFLSESDMVKKAKIAIESIKLLINPHGKPDLPDTLQRLYYIESMLRNPDNGNGNKAFYEVQRKSRDHVIHALNTYLLGLMLIEKLNLPTPPGFDFQWKLTSLFHDIGYPLEIAKKIIDQSTIIPLNELVAPELRGTEYCVKFNLTRFTTLTTREKSLELMQRNFTSLWELDANAKTLYRSSTRQGKIKHGVISSLLLMAHLDLCYKQNNPENIYEDYIDGQRVSWARKTFHEHIVPSCAAIMLHDAHKANFNRRKIKREVAPLAWLLRVCDALQDWDRPRSGSHGIPADQYQIGFSNGVIFFGGPEDRIKGIWNDDLGAIHEKECSIHILKR